MARSDSPLRNVLVMRLSALGDVAMTIPVLYPVCKANPDTRFVMLTKQWPASMFHDRPDNLMVVGADVKSEYKGLAGLMRLSKELRRQYGIDAVVDLHNVLRTRVIGLCMKWHGIPVAHLDSSARAVRHWYVMPVVNRLRPPTGDMPRFSAEWALRRLAVLRACMTASLYPQVPWCSTRSRANAG